MSDLNNIISISITRQSTSVTEANFGVIAIIDEFLIDKTTVTFDRYRYYASLTEMTDDGWASTDEIYKAAQKVFAQNPRITRIMVGRKDSGDADWTAALNAIQSIVTDWYGVVCIIPTTSLMTFDIDFETSNSIVFTVNGTAVTVVPFNTTNAQTYTDLKTQIELDIAGSVVTTNDTARTVAIEIPGTDVVASVVVTLGTNQPVGTMTYADNATDLELVSDWFETQNKLGFIESLNVGILDSGVTDDIASYADSNNYDRTIVIYNTSREYSNAAWPAECFPYDPGSQTWKFKTPSGITSYEIKSGQKTIALGKNCNVYTEVGDVDITENGTVGSGEFIDVMRSVDWIVARIQGRIFSIFTNNRKVPFTNEGIESAVGIVRGVLQDGVDNSIIVPDSYKVSAPTRDEVPTNDRANRLLPDVPFTGDLAGAIHSAKIDGILSI